MTFESEALSLKYLCRHILKDGCFKCQKVEGGGGGGSSAALIYPSPPPSPTPINILTHYAAEDATE